MEGWGDILQVVKRDRENSVLWPVRSPSAEKKAALDLPVDRFRVLVSLVNQPREGLQSEQVHSVHLAAGVKGGQIWCVELFGKDWSHSNRLGHLYWEHWAKQQT